MNKMKKLLGVLIFIGASALFASESSTDSPEVLEGSKTFFADNCFSIPSSDYVDKYSVRLEKSVPSIVLLDEDVSYRYIVVAKDKLKKVVVKDEIPAGATYVSSTPTAEIDEGVVTWTLYNLKKAETVPLELVVNAAEISDFSSSATVDAYLEASTTVSVGVPKLALETSTIIESVLLNSDVIWKIIVTNTGNYCAENVVITNSLPKELVHSSGNNNPVLEIGSLAPGESREISIDTMAVEVGEFCNAVVVTASNTEPVQDEACITVLESGLEINVKGPKKQFVGKEATYMIDIVNTGDVPFREVTVTDRAPEEAELTNAEGAVIDGNTAVWTTSLAAGEKKSFEASLLIKTDGSFCNEVSATTTDFVLDVTDSACTQWRGYPALLIEVLDTQDPLVIGEETTYVIQIANQGTADDTNVKLEVQMPKGLSLISVAGDTKGKINKNSIKFAPYPVLKAKEIIQYRVVAKAVQSGDLRFKAKMSSDLLKSPVPEEESTQAY